MAVTNLKDGDFCKVIAGTHKGEVCPSTRHKYKQNRTDYNYSFAEKRSKI